jgi:hypothetical protein
MREDCDPSEKEGLAVVERRRAKLGRGEREVGRVFERVRGRDSREREVVAYRDKQRW